MGLVLCCAVGYLLLLFGKRLCWWPEMADSMAPLPAWSAPLSYGAIFVLLGAQVGDLWLYRQCARSTRPALVSPEPDGTPDPRKERV